MAKPEMYFSVDIEADGPIPGAYSMLSIGCVALDDRGCNYGEFSANLETLPQAQTDPTTMKWWQSFPEAWAAHRVNPEPPLDVMLRFAAFVNNISDEVWHPVIVCAPSGFDFTFVYWYFVYFTGQCPFGFSCLDMASYAMGALKKTYRKSTKKHWPAAWRKTEHAHTHIALDDAREQADMFVNMLSRINGV